MKNFRNLLTADFTLLAYCVYPLHLSLKRPAVRFLREPQVPNSLTDMPQTAIGKPIENMRLVENQLSSLKYESPHVQDFVVAYFFGSYRYQHEFIKQFGQQYLQCIAGLLPLPSFGYFYSPSQTKPREM